MTVAPDYFASIRDNAARRWDQLESDPELAGPWHQLFKQVQSPRHVVSELLQNADDAGATEASVRIDEATGEFVFSHNGEDFSAEQFGSLCRFGYSNKRALHTIGFRGIGFKSTFSLGDTVELSTPSLNIAFDRQRFTQPVWQPGRSPSERTQIRVAIADDLRRKELQKNFAEWIASPYSLVFFNNIRRIDIQGEVVEWTRLGSGPVERSQWMALNGANDAPFLLLRSAPESFPAEALDEIRNERMLGAEQELDFPPCSVELLLGAPGRLYVVLPTGVETSLPYACNAPFIQDPARFKIKPPETSPTNRWLLERAGTLAASAMANWLAASQLPASERVRAYALLPDPDVDDSTLEGHCAELVYTRFEKELEDLPVLLTEDDSLVYACGAMDAPTALLEAWPHAFITERFDSLHRHCLSRLIPTEVRARMAELSWVESLHPQHILQILCSRAIPRPANWSGLRALWAWVDVSTQTWQSRDLLPKLHLVPVQGRDDLQPASRVVRLGERKLLQSEADWTFLAPFILAADPGWLRYLAELGERHAGGNALALLARLRLEDTTEINRIAEQFCGFFFRQGNLGLQACVRIAQICAKLNVAPGKSLSFVTRNGQLHIADTPVAQDADGTLGDLLPADWCDKRLLHTTYTENFVACTAQEWRQWIESGRSGLVGFAPLTPVQQTLTERTTVGEEIRWRGGDSKPEFHYKTNRFVVDDWDFPRDLWKHWQELANEQLDLWCRIGARILDQPSAFWSQALGARIFQESTSGTKKSIVPEFLPASWILKLRDHACLPDTRGFARAPAELLRRTPETEPLMEVEPFIDLRFDNDSTRSLLKLLGVRDQPAGPQQLLARLRALARADTPPLAEVEKWYRRLDQMMEHGSTEDAALIRNAFQSECLILDADGGWISVSAVFISADEDDAPGVALVRESVRDLALWKRVGVAERPTAELALQWLATLPSGQPVPPDELRRVRALLARHAQRVWLDRAHWLNLAGEWAPVGGLRYALSMRAQVQWKHLHDHIKRRTADFSHLPAEHLDASPFNALPSLASRIEERLLQIDGPGAREHACDWLQTLGELLTRVCLDDTERQASHRALATKLATARWTIVSHLQTMAYIDGEPAGLPRAAEVVWQEHCLYIADLPLARLACLVPEALGARFGDPAITAALAYCFERGAREVRAYVTENFTLEAPQPRPATSPVGGTTQPTSPLPALPATAPNAMHGSADPTITQPAKHDDTDDEPDESVVTTPSTEPKTQVPTAKPPAPPATPKPPKVDLVERFAHARGMRRVESGRFVNEAGASLVREAGAVFPWQWISGNGEVIQYYWTDDHCLDDAPLQLPTEVWRLVEQAPEHHALLLSDGNSGVREFSGDRLRHLKDQGRLTIHPATYRITLKHD